MAGDDASAAAGRGAAAAAAENGGMSQPPDGPSSASVPWALAGYGPGGRVFHAPLIASAAGLELVAVVTRDGVRRAAVAADWPGTATVDRIEDLPALGVRGVTVATSSGTHSELARRALDVGLAVVVDKPFALTAAAARGLLEHAAAAGLMLTAYQNRRWDSDLLTVRALVASGRLGRVHRFTSRIDRFRSVSPERPGTPVEQGGGTLYDLGPHLIDQAVVLWGPVARVHAQLRTVRAGSPAEDDIELHLAHHSGVLSTLAAGQASAAAGPRFQVNGTAGGFTIDGFDGQEAQLKAGGSPATLGAAWGVEPESAWGLLVTAAGRARMRSLRGRWDTFYPAVARAVLGTGAVPVDPADAIVTAQILDAARLSANTGGSVELG